MKRIKGCFMGAVVALFAVLPSTALAQAIHDIAVSISESADPVTAGSGVGNLTYTVTATNNGAAEATGLHVSVTFALPAGVTVHNISSSQGGGSFPGSWDIFTLAGGASATLQIALTVSNAAGYGADIVSISAYVLALDGTDPDPANDSDAETTTIRTVATINVSKDFSDDSTAGVAVQLSCSFGNTEDTISEGAVWNINAENFAAGATCQATETVPAGYEVSYSADCNVDPILSSSTYNCLITNTQLPVQLVVNKTFTDGIATDVLIDVVCGAGTVTADDPTASGSDPAEFTISDFPVGGTTCTATETLPSGYGQASTTCTDVAITVGSTPSCEFVNVPLRATFAVTKTFTDGNPGEVLATLSCNTGLPIVQSQTISATQDVTFVVTSFDTGELDCNVTEDLSDPALAGYTPTYHADADATGVSDACEFVDVVGDDDHTCAIVNDPAPVPVVIVKDWIIDGVGGDQVDQRFELTLVCDAPIVGAQRGSGYECGFAVAGGGERPPALSCLELYGVGDTTFTPKVIPQWPDSHCWVVEEVYDDAVEVDNGCGDINVSHGQGDECLITNTVFFEGIPTLSQYGMAILALLMLGVGLVGFRRFA